jgi:protein-tyrosine-phosphatase
LNIVTLCTGNVARSVMLGFMLTTIAESTGSEWRIRSAGTHVTEGAAMSARTRDALLKIDELGDHRYGAHRSHQLTDVDAAWADVILCAEVDNVSFVRARHASEANKAVQLAQFVRFAPLDGDLVSRLRVTNTHEAAEEFNVADPAGGDQVTYDDCARQLWDLAQAFALIVGDDRAP